MSDGWGGARNGSGRKRKPVKILKKATAEQILSQIDEIEGWNWAWTTAKAKQDVKAAVEILAYLTNRRDGKPAQSVDVKAEENRTVILQWGDAVPEWLPKLPQSGE
jgi:hypothetical protein